MQSQEALIAAGLSRRDPEIIEQLVRQYQATVLRYLLVLTRSRDEAEDLSQETWVRVLERGFQYRGDWTFETWLLAIARNLAIDAIRRASRRRIEAVEAMGSHQVSPYEAACKAEEAGRLRTVVRRLPPRLHAVWQLRFEHSLPLAAIATRLHLAPGTVRSRLHRSMKAVCASLKS